MNYKSDHCFTNTDLFDNFNTKSVNLPKDLRTREVNKGDSRRQYVSMVLMYCLYLIILDIIENNVTFVFPLFGGQEGCFYVKMFEGEEFRQRYAKGKFFGIDFLQSNFKGYQIYFQYTYKGGVREKPIYISRSLKDKFYENINNGKQYY